MNQISNTIKHLIIINVIMFVATQMIGHRMIDLFAMHYPTNPNFRIWQPLTHMFMHGGIMHIVFNMYGLWIFGSPLEQRWGKNKFLFFYFAAGLGAVLIYTGVQYYQFTAGMQTFLNAGFDQEAVMQGIKSGSIYAPENLHETFKQMSMVYLTPMLGASGAVYGLLAAFAIYYPFAELMLIFLPFPIKAKYFVPLLVLSDLIFGFTSQMSSPIAHLAHVGGALIGFLIAWKWKNEQFEQNRWY